MEKKEKSMEKFVFSGKTGREKNRFSGFVFTVILFAYLFLLPFCVLADEPDKSQKTYELEDIVVSTTRSEIPVSDAAQSVTVLSQEDIMASPFERVEDILRTVPGVYNTRHYGRQTSGVSNPITLRGVGGNRVLLLVDGVPQNHNFNNSIAWVAWGHIPKEAIQRIEIVRGPTSAMYGSEGIGGVVHIITKKPGAERRTSLRTEAGTSDTYAGHAFHSQKIKDVGLMIAGGYETSDGFYMEEDPESYERKRHRDVGKVFGKAAWELNDVSRLDFSGLHYDHETGKGREFFYDELQLDQYTLHYTRQPAGGMALNGLLYYNRADKIAYQDSKKDSYSSLLRSEDAPSSTWGAELESRFPFHRQNSLMVGISFKETAWDYDDNFVDSDRDEGSEGTQQYIAPFADMNLKFFEQKVIVNLGARYDWIRTSDGANWDDDPDVGEPYDNEYASRENSSFSPKFGITYHPDEKTTLRASAGKGFRAPSLFELYKVHVRGGGKYYREPNPELEPEKIWAYDLGVEKNFLDNFKGSLTFYQSFAKDYIDSRLTNAYEEDGATFEEYILDNVSKVDIHGIEAELNWHARNDLMVFGNYTWNVSEVKETEGSSFEEGHHLTGDPKHKFHVGTTYQNPQVVSLTLIWNYYVDKYYYVDELTQDTEEFWSVDARISRCFFDRVTAYLNVENVFDSVDNESIAPGTIYTAGVEFTF